MHLHNRQIKASFWNDPELLTWPREERWFYEGLTQLADDSGCLEDSPFAFKLNLYPSPLDSDVAVCDIEGWRDSLLTRKKLVRYTSEHGKPCLYIINFHKHQSFKNPQKPDVPLPPWITWSGYSSNKRAGKYAVLDDILTEFLQSSYDVLLREVKLREVKLIKEKLKEKEDESLVESFTNTGEKTEEKKESSSLSNEFRLIARAFQEEGFGQPSPLIAEQLKVLYDDFGYEWVMDAFTEAATQGVRKLSYVERTLGNWKREGHAHGVNSRIDVAATKSGGKTDVRKPSSGYSTETDEEWEVMESNYFARSKDPL